MSKPSWMGSDIYMGNVIGLYAIILDEAQNTTVAQMKMFLNRMGAASKVIVTGDLSQIDLPGQQNSGLANASHVLRGVEGIEFCRLSRDDIVRHVVVQRIVHAYGSWEEAIRQRDAAERRGDGRDESGGRDRGGKRRS